MKKTQISVITTLLLIIAGSVLAENFTGITFLSSLSLGESSPAVLSLQKFLNSDPDTRISDTGPGSPGMETNYFGSLTKNAVIRFQEKYKNEILTPVGLSYGTGYVGAMTIKKINALVLSEKASPVVTNQNQAPSQPSPTPYNPANNSIVPSGSVNVSKTPVVLSVSPEKVRRGDTVTITGKNFTPTDNTVFLGDGPIKTRFDGLPSYDGKTISFVYKPPIIKTMSVEEIKSLPADMVSQIETPIKSAGLTLDQVLSDQDKIKDESSYKDFLQKNGHSFDEMYHYFYIIVENSNGKGMSDVALLHGLRNMPYDNIAQNNKPSFLSKVGDSLARLFDKLVPTADALGMNGGGYTSGIIMVCTCNGSLMTFQLSFTGGGTGLYVFPPGFIPSAGSGLVAGPWLGGYQIMGGSCSIYAGITCIPIPGNAPQKPVGYAF